MGCLTFERTWPYIADEKATRKHAFASLHIIGRGKVDLAFLASETSMQPENTRVRSFVLSHSSEGRLRRDRTNLEDAGQIVANVLEYMRSSKTGK